MRIIVGITGGIAAYKAPELVRLLKKAGHEVRCAATEHALEFVTRVTLETVSGNALYTDLFASGRTEHISLKDWGEMLVVAPATANIIGKYKRLIVMTPDGDSVDVLVRADTVENNTMSEYIVMMHVIRNRDSVNVEILESNS